MLVQRPRRCASIVPALGERLVLTSHPGPNVRQVLLKLSSSVSRKNVLVRMPDKSHLFFII